MGARTPRLRFVLLAVLALFVTTNCGHYGPPGNPRARAANPSSPHDENVQPAARTNRATRSLVNLLLDENSQRVARANAAPRDENLQTAARANIGQRNEARRAENLARDKSLRRVARVSNLLRDAVSVLRFENLRAMVVGVRGLMR